MKLKIEAMQKGKLGIVFPSDLIDSVGWEAGDLVEVEIHSDRLRVVKVETSFEQGIRIAEQAMDDYRETLQALAKM
jgi:antitoxin component of MazEF toxin-antitoxin module